MINLTQYEDFIITVSALLCSGRLHAQNDKLQKAIVEEGKALYQTEMASCTARSFLARSRSGEIRSEATFPIWKAPLPPVCFSTGSQHTYVVMSAKYMNLWNCKTNTLIVLPNTSFKQIIEENENR